MSFLFENTVYIYLKITFVFELFMLIFETIYSLHTCNKMIFRFNKNKT
jgi:hypothetical protein